MPGKLCHVVSCPVRSLMVDELKIAGWGPPPADLSLGADEVHVWRGTVRASAGELDGILRALPRRERKDVERTDKPKVAAARRFMLRSLLGRYLGQEPGKVRLADGPDGREVLAGGTADGPHWDFGWAGTRAVFAISAGQRLGLHVQAVPDDLDVSELAAHVPPREAGLAEFLSARSRARAIVGYYAEQQAMRRLVAYVGDPKATPDAQVERLRLGKRFVAALAAEGWDWSPSFWAFGADAGDDE